MLHRSVGNLSEGGHANFDAVCKSYDAVCKFPLCSCMMRLVSFFNCFDVVASTRISCAGSLTSFRVFTY